MELTTNFNLWDTLNKVHSTNILLIYFLNKSFQLSTHGIVFVINGKILHRHLNLDNLLKLVT